MNRSGTDWSAPHFERIATLGIQQGRPQFRKWQTILSTHSLNEVLEILTEDSDEGQRLRQSSPFSGILSQRERLEIFRRYESAGT